jgi:cysteine desulfuration protein SufE
MTDIEQRQQDIIEEFEMFDSWDDKYQYIVDLGEELPPMDESLKNDDTLVHGCQSQVWISPQEKNGRLYFTADSDALIVKGVVRLILRMVNGATPQEIMAMDWSFLDKIGLKEHLSMNRANGLMGMLEKLQMYAKQYQ